MPLSSATLKTSCSTPSWVSFRFSMRASSSGPISEIVARTGWPCSPYTSQNVTGQAAHCGASSRATRAARPSFPTSLPPCAMPDRSPLTSAMNTGTPMPETPAP